MSVLFDLSFHDKTSLFGCVPLPCAIATVNPFNVEYINDDHHDNVHKLKRKGTRYWDKRLQKSGQSSSGSIGRDRRDGDEGLLGPAASLLLTVILRNFQFVDGH